MKKISGATTARVDVCLLHNRLLASDGTKLAAVDRVTTLANDGASLGRDESPPLVECSSPVVIGLEAESSGTLVLGVGRREAVAPADGVAFLYDASGIATVLRPVVAVHGLLLLRNRLANLGVLCAKADRSLARKHICQLGSFALWTQLHLRAGALSTRCQCP